MSSVLVVGAVALVESHKEHLEGLLDSMAQGEEGKRKHSEWHCRAKTPLELEVVTLESALDKCKRPSEEPPVS